MSLYVSENSWNLKLVDLNTSKSTSAAFGSADVFPLSLRIGDQFVIALESYTSNSTVFENMGNFTLESLLVNGARVTSGPYAYSRMGQCPLPIVQCRWGYAAELYFSERLGQCQRGVEYLRDGHLEVPAFQSTSLWFISL